MFLLAFAIPYHAPTLGVIGGLAGMALAISMVSRIGVRLDFDTNRPIGLALALYATLWLLISAVQLVRRHTPTAPIR
jgi:hypothetical protein